VSTTESDYPEGVERSVGTMNDLLKALQRAMLSERDGYQFYTMAAVQTEDPQAAKVFRHLAAEEKRHFEALQQEYQSVLDSGSWDATQSWQEPWQPPETGGIFSERFRRRLQGRHLEMAALSIGLLLEKQSFEQYTRNAEDVPAGEIRTFFQDLASWEEEHYRLLLREDERMRDDYWQENRFSPLL
jgi:rubrerythrin